MTQLFTSLDQNSQSKLKIATKTMTYYLFIKNTTIWEPSMESILKFTLFSCIFNSTGGDQKNWEHDDHKGKSLKVDASINHSQQIAQTALRFSPP